MMMMMKKGKGKKISCILGLIINLIRTFVYNRKNSTQLLYRLVLFLFIPLPLCIHLFTWKAIVQERKKRK